MSRPIVLVRFVRGCIDAVGNVISIAFTVEAAAGAQAVAQQDAQMPLQSPLSRLPWAFRGAPKFEASFPDSVM